MINEETRGDLPEFVEARNADMQKIMDETPIRYHLSGQMQCDKDLLENKMKIAKVRISDVVEEYYPDIAIAMSWGKDSMTILGLALELYPQLDLKVMFTDTGRKFVETYAFANRVMEIYPQLKRLDYHNEVPLLDCDSCRAWKVTAATAAPKHFGLRALIVGIRHDEHPARADTPILTQVDGVFRSHPIVEFTEADIWAYLELKNIPVHPLYTEGYRSIGCAPPCTVKTPEGAAERGGRQQDKEVIMHQLRGKGYW